MQSKAARLTQSLVVVSFGSLVSGAILNPGGSSYADYSYRQHFGVHMSP